MACRPPRSGDDRERGSCHRCEKREGYDDRCDELPERRRVVKCHPYTESGNGCHRRGDPEVREDAEQLNWACGRQPRHRNDCDSHDAAGCRRRRAVSSVGATTCDIGH